MWEGSYGLLLTEYFDNKRRLSELKSGRSFLSHRGKDTTEIDKEIKQVEMSIMEFISALDRDYLKSIIYMSLDMEVEIGLPDKLKMSS